MYKEARGPRGEVAAEVAWCCAVSKKGKKSNCVTTYNSSGDDLDTIQACGPSTTLRDGFSLLCCQPEALPRSLRTWSSGLSPSEHMSTRSLEWAVRLHSELRVDQSC